MYDYISDIYYKYIGICIYIYTNPKLCMILLWCDVCNVWKLLLGFLSRATTSCFGNSRSLFFGNFSIDLRLLRSFAGDPCPQCGHVDECYQCC